MAWFTLEELFFLAKKVTYVSLAPSHSIGHKIDFNGVGVLRLVVHNQQKIINPSKPPWVSSHQLYDWSWNVYLMNDEFETDNIVRHHVVSYHMRGMVS